MVEPYYDCDGITIYNADCREVLPQLGQFDLLLTDPPYGIGIAANPVRQKHKKKTWDNEKPKQYLIDYARDICGKQIIWGGNYFDLWPTRNFLVWDKQQPENFSLAMCELAWCSWDGNAKRFTRRVVGYEKQHPTQKPEELMRWCLSLVPDASTVLDPFMGSGTTLVAAKIEGRQAVGIEIDEKYCEAAVNRLAQGVLF